MFALSCLGGPKLPEPEGARFQSLPILNVESPCLVSSGAEPSAQAEQRVPPFNLIKNI